MHNEPYVHSLGALTGMQAMQMVKGGLKAIYCSGWQVAADANAAAQVKRVYLYWQRLDTMTHRTCIQYNAIMLLSSCACCVTSPSKAKPGPLRRW